MAEKTDKRNMRHTLAESEESGKRPPLGNARGHMEDKTKSPKGKGLEGNTRKGMPGWAGALVMLVVCVAMVGIFAVLLMFNVLQLRDRVYGVLLVEESAGQYREQLDQRSAQLDTLQQAVNQAQQQLEQEQAKLANDQKALENNRYELKQTGARQAAKYYEAMEPEQCARILEEMDAKQSAGILSLMEQTAASKVLSVMDAKYAAQVTQTLIQ